MSLMEKVLKIQPDGFVNFLYEQSPDMKIPRLKTLFVGFIISRSGFPYTLVLFEDGDEQCDT